MCTAFQQKEEKGIQIGKALGEKRGIQIGEERGIHIGENRVNHLLQRMIEDGRMNEINRMASDRAYQEKLFQEYGI